MAFRLLKVSPSFARHMSTNATTVGFIGLGQMGNRMATNLINKVLHGERDKRRQRRVTCPQFRLKIIEKFSRKIRFAKKSPHDYLPLRFLSADILLFLSESHFSMSLSPKSCAFHYRFLLIAIMIPSRFTFIFESSMRWVANVKHLFHAILMRMGTRQLFPRLSLGSRDKVDRKVYLVASRIFFNCTIGRDTNSTYTMCRRMPATR